MAVDALMGVTGQIVRYAKSINTKVTQSPKKYKFNASDINKLHKITP